MDGVDWIVLPIIGAGGLFAAGIAGYWLGVWGALTAFGGVILISLLAIVGLTETTETPEG